MTEFISTMPLLVFFNVAWFICFALGFYTEEKVKKIPFFFLAAVFSILIISNAVVEIHAVSSTGADITISAMGVMHLDDLFYMHIGIFSISLILILYYFISYGYSFLVEGRRGR